MARNTQHKTQTMSGAWRKHQPAWKQYLYSQQSQCGQDSEAKSPTPAQQLADDGLFFKYMLDLVPANFYFSQETRAQLKRKVPAGGADDGDSTDSSDDEDDDEDDGGEQQQPPKTKGKQVKRKGLNNMAEAARSQKKKVKYDIHEARTVTQMQEDLLERAREKKSKGKMSADLGIPSGSPGTSQPGGDLREKLRLKLAGMQAKRKATDDIERIEKKKQKRRDSKKRLKQKKQADKQSGKGQKINGLLTPKSKIGTPSKPIFNKEGKMVFSKFDFTDSSSTAPKKTDLPTGSNYKQLLQKVENQKKKMQELQSTDAKKAAKLKEKTAWKTALQKAEGVKIKDNPELLKKAIKKKEQKKDKRKKEWKDRTEKVDKQMQKLQDKRTRNIKKRKTAKIEKKIKHAKKKGRIIPGF